MRHSTCLRALASFVLPAGLFSACGSSEKISAKINPDVLSAAPSPTQAKENSACLDPAKVVEGVEYFCADGKKRVGELSVPVCSKDNEKGCITTENFSAFAKEEREKIAPGRIQAGLLLAGVTGTLTATGPAECAADGEVACVSNAAFAAASTSGLAAKVLTGRTVAGLAGSAPVRPVDCAAEGGMDCVVAGTTTFRAVNTAGLASIVISTASVAGVMGNVTLPAFSDVKSAVQYGVAGTGATGSYSGADLCTSDGQINCTIPGSGSIVAADKSNFDGWDIRKKRNQTTGAVLTFAGVAGQNKACRNRAYSGVITIDDFSNDYLGVPPFVPAWTVINSVNYGRDFACGGIYATGSVTAGATGADASIAHDPDGNWQDLTPGILPGGASSGTPANGCNAADKHCVFKELISGLMVTEKATTDVIWTNAISYCNTLGEMGGAVTSPIPVIGGANYNDWRLPTQKELMQLYQGGIRGLNQTAALRLNFLSADNIYWSSTTPSYDVNASAWSFSFDSGWMNEDFQTPTTHSVLCVR